ncbi:MAG: hypothetical protein Q9226_003296 [Calogaya cf. arnoldii]
MSSSYLPNNDFYAPLGRMEQLASIAAAKGVGGGVKVPCNEKDEVQVASRLFCYTYPDRRFDTWVKKSDKITKDYRQLESLQQLLKAQQELLVRKTESAATATGVIQMMGNLEVKVAEAVYELEWIGNLHHRGTLADFHGLCKRIAL